MDRLSFGAISQMLERKTFVTRFRFNVWTLFSSQIKSNQKKTIWDKCLTHRQLWLWNQLFPPCCWIGTWAPAKLELEHLQTRDSYFHIFKTNIRLDPDNWHLFCKRMCSVDKVALKTTDATMVYKRQRFDWIGLELEHLQTQDIFSLKDKHSTGPW